MWINLLRIISIICFFAMATNCKFPKKEMASTTPPPLDSLYVGIQTKNEILMGNALADSLVNIYIDKADKFEPYHILSSSFGTYKAFQDGFYQLSKDTYGKIISFEPESSGNYYSVQLFIENDKGDIIDAIELAYAYGEEGANGVGTSYIIREDNKIKVFTKKYWIVFEYYMPDERENTDLVLDTFMVHEIQQQLKVSLPIDSSTKIQMEKMFENK